jgi:hypothetical protein
MAHLQLARKSTAAGSQFPFPKQDQRVKTSLGRTLLVFE